MYREIEEVVEYLLEECASPQQLVQSYRPKIPPQSVSHRHSDITNVVLSCVVLCLSLSLAFYNCPTSVGKVCSAQNVDCLCVEVCRVIVFGSFLLMYRLYEVIVHGY